MSLKNKIILPLLVLLVILFGMFVYSAFSLNKLINELEATIRQTQKINDLTIRIGFLKQEVREKVLIYTATNDPGYIRDIDALSNEVYTLLDMIKPMIVSENGKKLLAKYESSLDDAKQSRIKYLSDYLSGTELERINSLRSWEAKSENNHAILMDMQNYNLHSLERDHRKFVVLFNRTLFNIVLLVVTTGSILALYYFYLHRVIIAPLNKLIGFAREISAGNFETGIQYSSNDELNDLSQSLRSMARKLESYYTSLKKNISLKELELIKIKELDAQKDNFLNIASHELKTPVTSIKIYTQLLERKLKKTGNKDYNEFFVKINEQITSINSLVSSLLDATKIRAGKMPFTFSSFDLNKLLKDKVEVTGRISRIHKISLTGSISKKAYGDKERIGQVINNLLSNAVKYSPRGGQISVKAEELKNEFIISVSDRGVGLDNKQRKKIFERFFRAQDPETGSVPGLGIGLYISSEIVKHHGGRIWVESEKGKGSTFFFSIPFNRINSKKIRSGTYKIKLPNHP